MEAFGNLIFEYFLMPFAFMALGIDINIVKWFLVAVSMVWNCVFFLSDNLPAKDRKFILPCYSTYRQEEKDPFFLWV